MRKELCLIITPHEEDSLNTSKEAPKKDQYSILQQNKTNPNCIPL